MARTVTVQIFAADAPAVRACLGAAVELLGVIEETPEDFVADSIVEQAARFRAVLEEHVEVEDGC